MLQACDLGHGVCLEHDRGRPTAIVEYKHEFSVDAVAHSNHDALINLGDRAGLPVFVVYYAADFSWWQARPLNAHARQWITGQLQMCEREWVELLCRMRGHTLPESVLARHEV